jgi:hypothetical protein
LLFRAVSPKATVEAFLLYKHVAQKQDAFYEKKSIPTITAMAVVRELTPCFPLRRTKGLYDSVRHGKTPFFAFFNG